MDVKEFTHMSSYLSIYDDKSRMLSVFNELVYLDHLMDQNPTMFVIPVGYVKDRPKNKYDVYFVYGQREEIPKSEVLCMFPYQKITNCFEVSALEARKFVNKTLAKQTGTIVNNFPVDCTVGCYLSPLSLKWYLDNLNKDVCKNLQHKTFVSTRIIRCLSGLFALELYTIKQFIRDVLTYGLVFIDAPRKFSSTSAYNVFKYILPNSVESDFLNIGWNTTFINNLLKENTYCDFVNKLSHRNANINLDISANHYFSTYFCTMLYILDYAELKVENLSNKQKRRIEEVLLKKVFSEIHF